MYALLFVLVQTGVINFYYESTFINIMINIIYAVGLNLILGVAGQFSLGHAGFIAIGSYSGAILGKMMNGLPGLFAGMAVGVVISVIVHVFVKGTPLIPAAPFAIFMFVTATRMISATPSVAIAR